MKPKTIFSVRWLFRRAFGGMEQHLPYISLWPAHAWEIVAEYFVDVPEHEQGCA